MVRVSSEALKTHKTWESYIKHCPLYLETWLVAFKTMFSVLSVHSIFLYTLDMTYQVYWKRSNGQQCQVLPIYIQLLMFEVIRTLYSGMEIVKQHSHFLFWKEVSSTNFWFFMASNMHNTTPHESIWFIICFISMSSKHYQIWRHAYS